jgi:hypothetical protein
MDNYIYVGGAVGHSKSDGSGGYTRDEWFMPVLIKLDNNFKYVWGYRMDYRNDYSSHYPEATTEINAKISRSVDILFADHQNDKIYGLIVKRVNSGELR